MPDVGSADHASGILFAFYDPVHTGGMQKMEIKRIMSHSEEKLLEQKLTSLFTLREKAEDYRDEYRYVRNRTEELIYLIPSALLLISEDLCSTIFLSLYPRIDKIIFSYRISQGTGYINYLKAILRFRAKTILKRNEESSSLESTEYCDGTSYSFAHEQSPDYYIQRFENAPVEKAVFYDVSLKDMNSRKQLFSDINECYQMVINHMPGKRKLDNPVLEQIRVHLKDYKNRRDMLLLLLYCSDDYDTFTIENLALVFDVPASSIAALASFSHELRSDIHEKVSREREVRNKHFLRFIALSRSIEEETDEEKRQELIFLRGKCEERLSSKHERLRNIDNRLSVRKLSSALNIPPSTVSRCIRNARAYLDNIMTVHGKP